jgi:hypothetical protein
MTRAWIVVSLLAAACAVEPPELSDEVSASTAGQGVSYQGVSYQGVSYQGVSYQGTSYEGTDYEASAFANATRGGLTFSEGKVVRTALSLWRELPNGWEERLPDKVCLWNTARTSVSCTATNLSTSPSPLAGARIRTSFRHPDTGAIRLGWLRIGTSTNDVGAILHDTSIAMHDGYETCTQTVPYGPKCGNPNGCRRNCDLWVYDIDLIDTDGSVHPFCKPGHRAMALGGTWNQSGAYSGHATKFTFACTNGTIAKCTQWGYRPFPQTVKNSANETSSNLSSYHQACIRAATADYCASGRSFTKDGTLIDIYDYRPYPSSAKGYIPRTSTVGYNENFDASAFVWESEFDRHGATAVDLMRYVGLGSIFGADGCPDRFALGTAPMPDSPHRPMTRHDAIPVVSPVVNVDTTTMCPHSEQMTGRGLHPTCSACTHQLWEVKGDYPCIRADGAWTSGCITDANNICGKTFKRLAAHDECTAGDELNLYDTACTIAVCGDPSYASCCTNGWTSTCVSVANSRCRGGRENNFVGFCGSSILENDAGG